MQLPHRGPGGQIPPQQGGRSQFSGCSPYHQRKYLKSNTALLLKSEANWWICNIEMDIQDVLCKGALIIVDTHVRLAPTGEKWDDKRGNFLSLKTVRNCVSYS